MKTDELSESGYMRISPGVHKQQNDEVKASKIIVMEEIILVINTRSCIFLLK